MLLQPQTNHRLSYPIRSAISAVSVLVLVFSPLTVLADNSEPTEPALTVSAHLTTTLDAFEARQNRTTSLRMVWQESLDERGRPRKRKTVSTEDRVRSEEMVPEEGARYSRRFILVLERTRIRLDEKGQSALGKNRVPYERYRVFDGSVGTEFSPNNEGPHPVGRIGKDVTKNFVWDYASTWPLMAIYRGKDWGDRYCENVFKLGRTSVESIDNRECVVVKGPSVGQHKRTLTVWLDPAQDYSIVRVTTTRDNCLHSQLDVSHKKRWKRVGSEQMEKNSFEARRDHLAICRIRCN